MSASCNAHLCHARWDLIFYAAPPISSFFPFTLFHSNKTLTQAAIPLQATPNINACVTALS